MDLNLAWDDIYKRNFLFLAPNCKSSDCGLDMSKWHKQEHEQVPSKLVRRQRS